MSPKSLRSYRAELLLRREFEGLRGSVLADVRSRLRAAGVHLDERDLDACYAVAWHSLYAAQLEGREIGSRAGWLALVTFRRALDEHRVRRRGQHDGNGACELAALDADLAAAERDLAAELDDRTQLRHLFEALRIRLGGRELQAAALCYLHGLSRADAARAMGVSEARMQKLMEGRGRGSRGVAGKVAALLETIRAGAWCEEQASLMRGLAYGMLDPAGERYALAIAHTGACPACRAYVASLRGLAVLVPPAPALLELLAGAGSAKAVGGGAASAASAGAGGASGAGAAVAGGGAAQSVAASGVAGAAGGGWLLAGGGLGAKLAAGCLLALGVGAGCAVLGVDRSVPAAHRSAHVHARSSAVRQESAAVATGAAALGTIGTASVASGPSGGSVRAAPPSSAGGRASLEFGPEQSAARASAAGAAESASTVRRPAVANAARAGAEFAAGAAPAANASEPAEQAPAGESRAGAAQREFSPG
jgi:DNA-directed RNA polymerase specialized sigma24 family protein